MAVDHIRYDILTQDALRGVVRTVLLDAAQKGLPGDHHFYISFATRAEGVQLSSRMLEQYPKEITIVLQHQFWDLVVTDTGFEVGLSFAGAPERLVVPFAAIKGFFDPSVQFGLQFEEIGEAETEGSAQESEEPSKHEATQPVPIKSPPTSAPAASTAAPGPVRDKDTTTPAGGGEVVRLDRFRKK
jgi:hypothetical protein